MPNLEPGARPDDSGRRLASILEERATELTER